MKVPWKVGGSQAAKRYSRIDLGQDPPVLCLQKGCLGFVFSSDATAEATRTWGVKSVVFRQRWVQRTVEKKPKSRTCPLFRSLAACMFQDS